LSRWSCFIAKKTEWVADAAAGEKKRKKGEEKESGAFLRGREKKRGFLVSW